MYPPSKFIHHCHPSYFIGHYLSRELMKYGMQIGNTYNRIGEPHTHTHCTDDLMIYYETRILVSHTLFYNPNTNPYQTNMITYDDAR
jgi:hypothetical protein